MKVTCRPESTSLWRSGGVHSTHVKEATSCQILYFLSILSKVKITLTIFKSKLLECSAEEQEMHYTHHCALSKQSIPVTSQSGKNTVTWMRTQGSPSLLGGPASGHSTPQLQPSPWRHPCLYLPHHLCLCGLVFCFPTCMFT